MTELQFNTRKNLQQINAIQKTRIKNDYNQNLLYKRIKQAKKEVQKLRKFANRKNNNVSIYCNELANLIEASIKA